MGDINEFRQDIRDWVKANCAASLRGQSRIDGGALGATKTLDTDAKRWFDACLQRGFTVPTWPKAYHGAELSGEQHRVLRQELGRYGAPAPLTGMGTIMIGPTLLEFGNDAQKLKHLPGIATGEVRWCQGYSEPGAGSDLAALQTKAVDKGDYYEVNGQKIWTSGAQYADWMFALVRTDPDAAKHDGISFLLLPMNDPGVTVRPIQLINGASPFCETFFDNVRAEKADLVGQKNRGWAIGKRLLEYERSSISSGSAGNFTSRVPLYEIARQYEGEHDGKIANPVTRDRVIQLQMDSKAFSATRSRSQQENVKGGTPTFATSMFKYYSSELTCREQDTAVYLRGVQGVGWEGESFAKVDLQTTRAMLFGKALTIAGGSSEVQLNIIAKRVLGLPD
ncbi:MAG: acyl-CoA dehydrogenase family protein [Pseudomonadales bacterium]|nr:acyl-CoA dehydrogenase family protein [Pseudomonadales bacterium]